MESGQFKAKRVSITALALAGLGALGCVFCFFQDSAGFAFSYLTALVFFICIALGGLFFVLIHHLTRAGWSVVVRRIAEHVMSNLQWMGIMILPLAIPLALGSHELFHWADHSAVEHDTVLQSKAAYLNVPFFLVRTGVYFTLWFLVSRFLWSRSVKQDADGDKRYSLSLQKWSTLGIILYAISETFFAFDWIMSLYPHWFSTILGVYFFSCSALVIMAVLIIISVYLRVRGFLKDTITLEHYHDLGKLLFGWNMFWGYIAFSQFLLIWYANLGEETPFFHMRAVGSWKLVSLALPFGHFAIPFFFMISRNVKRNIPLLTASAVWLVGISYVDIFWLIMPNHSPEGVHFGLADISSFLLLGGMFVFWTIRKMESCSLIPEKDPRLHAKIKQAFMKGITSVVVDPIKTSLAELATYHLQIRPGTNVAILNMIAHYIIKENLVNKDFIFSYTEKYEEFKNHVENLDMNELEILTGVSKELVRKAAMAYASADKAMEFHGLGVTEHYQGSKTVMLLSNLAMMTGNIGRKGVGLNPLRGQNNVQGSADMGVQPHQGAGYLDVNNPDIQQYYAKKYGIEKMPDSEGLKIPEMLNAAIDGKIKALYIVGEDTIMTDPNSKHSIKAFEKLDLIVVQELFMTATSEMAHVVLPACSYFEKNGTFTNGERRIQRVNKVIEPIGNTKPDGQIIIDVMNKLGYNQPTGLIYDAEKVIEEIADVIPFMKGLSWERLGKNGLQWPIIEDGTDTKMLHAKGKFKKGIGTFHHFDFEETPEIVSHGKKYPFILTTGRELEHYNSGTMTRRTDNQSILGNDYLEVHPNDARKKGVKDEEVVRIFSDRGSVNIPIKYSKSVRQGVLRTTFHQPEVFINIITGSVADKETLTPEYKVVSVDFEQI